MASGECLRILNGHTNSVTATVFSKDTRYALSGSDDNTVRLWNVQSIECLRVLEEHTDSVTAVALSGEARYALSGSTDGDRKSVV